MGRRKKAHHLQNKRVLQLTLTFLQMKNLMNLMLRDSLRHQGLRLLSLQADWGNLE